MATTKRDSGDSAVYNRPLSGGGEASGDDDVEGHSMNAAKAFTAKANLRKAADDDDVEGHSRSRAVGDDDTEGHSRSRAVGDDDTEGHRITTGPVVKSRSRAVGDDDTEGHSRSR